MAPVRTGLDERLNEVRSQLVTDSAVVRRVYKMATQSLRDLDPEKTNDILDARDNARQQFWDRSGDILLILSLNQPLMGDLRMISTFLRGADTIERAVRHARDIATATRRICSETDITVLPKPLIEQMDLMWDHLDKLVRTLFDSIANERDLDVSTLRDNWICLSVAWDECQDIITTTPGEDIGSKLGRLLLVRALSRIERTGYNFVRLADHWHHAIHNEWVTIEN